MPNRPGYLAAMVLTGCAAAGAAGCGSGLAPVPRPLHPPAEGAVPVSQLSKAVKTRRNRDFLLVVRLGLTTVQVPMGLISDSEELWSHLDEEPVGAHIGAALAANGIRVGLGRKEAWPEIAKVLQRMTGQRLSSSSLHNQPGRPIPIQVKGSQPIQHIFVYRPDGTLYGRTFEPGDNILVVTTTTNYDHLGAVQLLGVPAIRFSRREPRYVRQGGGYVFTAAVQHAVLDDLAFRLEVPEGSFVVIGPGPGIRRRSSPGYHFLATRKKGLEFERVLIIAPQLWAVPLRKGRPGPPAAAGL